MIVAPCFRWNCTGSSTVQFAQRAWIDASHSWSFFARNCSRSSGVGCVAGGGCVHGVDDNPKLHPFANPENMCKRCSSNAQCGGVGNAWCVQAMALLSASPAVPVTSLNWALPARMAFTTTDGSRTNTNTCGFPPDRLS